MDNPTVIEGSASAAEHPDAGLFGDFFVGVRTAAVEPQTVTGSDEFWPSVLAYRGNDSRRLLRRRSATDPQEIAVQSAYAGLARFDRFENRYAFGFILDTPHVTAAWVRAHVAVAAAMRKDGAARRPLSEAPQIVDVRTKAIKGKIGVKFQRSEADDIGALSVSYFILAAGSVDPPADRALGERPGAPAEKEAAQRLDDASTALMLAGAGLALGTLALLATGLLYADRFRVIDLTP